MVTEREHAAAREIERLRANLVAIEDEKNAYIDYVGDALGQGEDESLWDAAQRVLSNRDRLRVALESAPKPCGFPCTLTDLENYRQAAFQWWHVDRLEALR